MGGTWVTCFPLAMQESNQPSTERDFEIPNHMT